MEQHGYAPNSATIAVDFAENIRALFEHLNASKVPFGNTPQSEAVQRAKTMMIAIAAPLPNGFTPNVNPEDDLAGMAIDLLRNGIETWEADRNINSRQGDWPKPNTIPADEEEKLHQDISTKFRCHNALDEAFGRVLSGWSDETIRELGERIRKYWRLAFRQKFPELQPTPESVPIQRKEQGRNRKDESVQFPIGGCATNEKGEWELVSQGRAWDVKRDGRLLTPNELLPHMHPDDLKRVKSLGSRGLQLVARMKLELDSPVDWAVTDDASVRELCRKPERCDSLCRQANEFDDAANTSFRIQTGDGIHCRPVKQFCDTDSTFEVNDLRTRLANLANYCRDWLTVAAWHRGILAADQALTDSALNQLYISVNAAPALTVEASASASSVVKGNRKNIDARMWKIVADNPDSHGWTVRQWAEHLTCSPSTVANTTTWKKHLPKVRAVAKAERRS